MIECNNFKVLKYVWIAEEDGLFHFRQVLGAWSDAVGLDTPLCGLPPSGKEFIFYTEVPKNKCCEKCYKKINKD